MKSSHRSVTSRYYIHFYLITCSHIVLFLITPPVKPEGTLSFPCAWLSACPSACQTIYRSFFLSLSVFLIISVGSNLAYMMRYQQEKLPFCLFIPFNISLKS